VRLFLDAHLSGRVIAEALRERGHDVRAADEERSLDGWDDERLLALATDEDRIMVTFNVRDFPRIVSEWAAAGRHHAGCLMILRLDHREFGEVLRVIDAALITRSDLEEWRDYTAWVSRSRPGSGRP
jgi:nucleoside-diphosphate-sugar epimerase